MRIRLYGTPKENQQAITELRKVFQISKISRPYPNDPPARTERVYITAFVASAGPAGEEDE